MKKLLKRIPLPIKLIGIGLIPIIVLVYFSIVILNEKNSRIEIISQYQERLKLSSVMIDLANALQLERRVSFSNSILHASRDELSTLRNRTNQKFENLLQFITDSTNDYIVFSGLNELNSTRDKIDSNLLKPADIMNYYSNSMLRLNSLAEIKTDHVPFLEPIMSELSGTLLLAEMVTYMGIIRGNIYYTMYQDSEEEKIKALPNLYAQFKMYTNLESEYLAKSPPENVIDYKNLINQGGFRETISKIGSIINNGNFNIGLEPEEWKALSASGVDELSSLQLKFHQKLEANINSIISKEINDRNKNLIFIICLIIFVVVLLFMNIQHITLSLKQLSEKASSIALGEVNINVPHFPNDAMGSLANSIRKIDETNQLLSASAAKIGKGNFDSPIPVRSEKDELANSLLNMQENLINFSEENAHTIWLQKGRAIVNDSLKGDQEMNKLSHNVLKALAEYLHADMGIIYISRSGFLRSSAGFAVENKASLKQEIPLGQYLTGQVAETGKPIYLKEVPEDYFKIASGLGNTAPRNLYIVPLVYKNSVEGVLEIAAISEFHEKTMELLELVSQDIAISIISEKSREKLQALLEETQTQAEELQSQHSELENLNQALEQQTDRLQVSEEELKVQQEELLQANKELEERSSELEELNQMIMERNKEIQEQAIRLEQASKYKSEFLANMSHELRTPLNSILLLSRLMAENHQGNLTEEQIDHARVIRNSGEGLLSMIDEILDLTKIEAGKMKLEPEEFSIDSLLSDVKSLFLPIAKQKNIDFHFELEEDVPETIFSDKSRIEQILRNLLSNAFKFTREGFISFKVKKDGEDHISFHVMDSGIGIPMEKQSLIFDAFQQADGSTRRNYGGSGLGLSISLQLAQLLKGSIKVNSVPGKGSEFWLTIPVKLKKSAVEESELPTNKQHIDRRNMIRDYSPFVLNEVPKGIPDDRNNIATEDKTIMIVEDDMNFARSILNFTNQNGFKGIVVPRGDDAFLTAKKLKPDAILLDVQLPVKSGWEVLEELKKDPETKNIPVHIMSSFEVKNESLGMGASNFIRKEEALDKIREIFAELEASSSGQPQKKIIIIEDNSMHAKALQFFINEYGISAAIASTFAEVHNLMTGEAFNAIIIDTGVHATGTYEIVEKIKEEEEFENTPVIIVTNTQISRADELRIKKIAKSIVIKTAHSFERVLDELSIFLQVLKENNEKRSTGRKEFNNTLTEVLGNKKVLIVDDDVRNIFALTKALEHHKMEVFKAIDGKEALEILQDNNDVDIVLLDIMMPVMDGFETLKYIRGNQQYKNLPVIAVTAKAMAGDREACINAGASDYISKPIDTDQLLSLLRVWLYHS